METPPNPEKIAIASEKTRSRDAQRLDDERTWTEWVILCQSPLWIVPVAAVMISGTLRRWSDIEYLSFSILVATPAVLVPALSPGRPNRGGPWWNAYWLKLKVWVAILVCMGTYTGTHYFFDLMGMRYSFDVRWTFSTDMVGHSRQQVPVFMYPLTHAYFMTYFTALMTAERHLVRRWDLKSAGRTVVIILISYSVAFLETFFMASPLLSDVFAYASRRRMLKLGSLGYASYFIAGLPMARRIDSGGVRWTLERVVIEALATCMMILALLEVWAKTVGPL